MAHVCIRSRAYELVSNLHGYSSNPVIVEDEARPDRRRYSRIRKRYAEQCNPLVVRYEPLAHNAERQSIREQQGKSDCKINAVEQSRREGFTCLVGLVLQRGDAPNDQQQVPGIEIDLPEGEFE